MLVARASAGCYAASVRRFGQQICALLLVWALTPGSGELAEHVVHLVREGHLAHATPDAQHHTADAEHDCSGPYHFCACHTGSSMLPPPAFVALAPPAPVRICRLVTWGGACTAPREPPFRPPIIS